MSIRSSRLAGAARAALLPALILPVATPVLAQSAQDLIDALPGTKVIEPEVLKAIDL